MSTHAEHPKWQERAHQRVPHKARHVESEIGHWVRTAAIAAPLLITEFVPDPDKRLKFLRVASITGVIASEALHSHRAYVRHERDRKALEDCATACAVM